MDAPVPPQLLALLAPPQAAEALQAVPPAPAARKAERPDLALHGLAGSTLREDAKRFVRRVRCLKHSSSYWPSCFVGGKAVEKREGADYCPLNRPGRLYTASCITRQ
jgi:hypothetical protein